MLKNKSILLIGGVALVAIGVLLWPSISGEEKLIERVQCITSERFHIHTELKIFVDGQEEVVPANIGIKPGCTRELHTHDIDGEIHVESAVDRGYKFSDFLWAWDESLDRPGYSLVMTVDGEETTNPDFVMKDKQQIVLNYTKNQ